MTVKVPDELAAQIRKIAKVTGRGVEEIKLLAFGDVLFKHYNESTVLNQVLAELEREIKATDD